MPASTAAIQTFGDFLGFNSHLHILVSDGCFVSALDFIAAICSHIPNKGEQIVHYYGYYSNIWIFSF